MYISYDYYRIFYCVAKYGSFTQAATVLLSNQPNLTRAIKNLEAELGCTLFVRSNKGVKLTPDGEKLYEHVSVAFEHIQLGEEEISLSRSMQKGIVTIGASEIALHCFILPILNQYRQRYPGIRIKISNVSAPQAVSLLKDGLIDLAVVTAPIEVGADLSQKKLKSFREVAVCGETFRQLGESGGLTLRQLSEYPIVSLGTKTSTYEFYFRLFLQSGLTFAPDIEAATADQILPLVQHNLGIGFVPEDFLRNQPQASGIYELPLAEPIPERAICLVKKKNHSLGLPAKELERMILAEN